MSRFDSAQRRNRESTTYNLVAGGTGGLLGGVLMLAVLVVLFPPLKVGSAFRPLYLFSAVANQYWGSIDGFSFGPFVVGLLLHLVMSLALGVLFAWLVDRSTGLVVVLSGVVWGLLVWAIMQLAVLQLFDQAAAERFPLWLFALSHVVYGVTVGVFLARVRAQNAAGAAPARRRVEAPVIREVTRPAPSSPVDAPATSHPRAA